MSAVESRSQPAPLSPEDLTAIRAHPGFREASEGCASEACAFYAGLSRIHRWALSDVGRASLTATAIIYDSSPLDLTPAVLVAGAAQTGVASRGRVWSYIGTALAYGLLRTLEPGARLDAETPLTVPDDFVMTITRGFAITAAASARLAPQVAPLLPRLDEVGFRRAVALWTGQLTQVRPDLFPGEGRPVYLFQGRLGGSRMLEALIVRQRPGRQHFLETCPLSQSALARVGFCSRRHVERLLKEGQAQGLLKIDGRNLTASPELSDDVERLYARMFAVTRTAVLTAAAQV